MTRDHGIATAATLPPRSRFLERQRWTPREHLFVWLGCALAAALLAMGSWAPSFWYDEAATVSGATRSWSSLWEMGGTIDAVHLAYYAFIHVLLDFLPLSEFTLRLPSAIFVALTGAVVYAIGRQISSPLAGAIAAVLFTTFPRVTWMAVEARSFALATLLASLLVLTALWVLRRRSWWPIAIYSVVAALAILVFLYNTFVVVAIPLAALASRASRASVVRLWLGSVIVGVALTPFLLIATSQRGQLGGLRPTGLMLPRYVFGEQFFLHATEPGVVFWVVILVTAALAFIRRLRSDDRTWFPDGWFAPTLLTLWLITPLVAVVLISRILGSSIYQPRAMTITAPALALIAGCLLVYACRSRVVIVWSVTIVLIGLMTPAYIHGRDIDAKGTDWRETAELVAELGTASRAVVYVDDRTDPWHLGGLPSIIRVAYPSQTRSAQDPTLAVPFSRTPGLWDIRYPLADVAYQLAEVEEVVVVRGTTQTASETVTVHSILQEQGFVLKNETSFRDSTVELWHTVS